MRIGELARRADVPTRTIRFYEGEGLLPEPARGPNGYREYGDADVQRLRFVRASQSAGFTLRQIAGILAVRDGGEAPCHHVRGLIEERLREIDERVAELERTRTALRSLADSAVDVTPDDCPPESICRIVPLREGEPVEAS